MDLTHAPGGASDDHGAPRPDVVVVGAGWAGLCAAWVLASQGVRVAVVDRRDEPGPVFRAEKLEPFQSALMQRFGLLDARRPRATPLPHVLDLQAGGVHRVDVGEQYGIRYGDSVVSLRETVSAHVPMHVARVAHIRTSADRQVVELADGQTWTPRLVVVATGPHETLTRDLGMRREPATPTLVTQSFGFDVAREDGTPFPFDGLNAHGRPGDHVDFVTLFRIDPAMRVNLFTVWAADDPRGRQVATDPIGALERFFPELGQHTGPLVATSRVQAHPTAYHRLEGVEQPGVVVIGDAYQAVSPATGTGLDKVLNDVAVLCLDHVPGWLATPGMGADKTRAFYADPRKRRVDQRAYREWVHAHERVLHPRRELVRSLPWKISRRLVHG